MKLKLFLVVMVAFVATVSAQKLKVESGDFNFLKGQTELKVVFDFDKTTFYNEKMSEEEYIAKRTKEIGDEKGKAEADKWLADWESSKANSFIDKFISSMNKNMKISASKDSDAKYTLIVETTWIYPGWFAGVMKQPAKVSTSLKFVETANPGNVLLVINSKDAPGDSYMGVANNNDRIAEGYAKTGKSLAKLIAKKAK
ncbi:MAG: hypothetical protein WCY25_00295 [Moheibacter sp.]